jgi:amidohydrolase
MEILKKQVDAIFQTHCHEIEDIVKKIHAEPELSGEEVMASEIQADLLERWQFSVCRSYIQIGTAFNAVFGKGRPHICFMSEYDALPGMGHGCGHNLIAGVALGAGIVLKELIRENGIHGQVSVMGTPAEEKRGGKVDLIRAGALEDVDVVLMAHPSDHATSQSMKTAGIMQFNVEFSGRTAHAAAAPEKGINALDAVRLMFSGVDAWRQQLEETCRIHGVIRDGGKAPNIIPDWCRADFYLRAFELDTLMSMKKRFENIAKGAALMTDTVLTFEEIPNSYKPAKPNDELNRAFMKLADEYGMNPEWEDPSRASSDFGNVTWELPAMHAYFNITAGNKDAVAHSKQFAKCAISEFALEQMGKTARILALMGYWYLTLDDFKKRVDAGFSRI